jgi:hypothetical protein
MSDCMLDDGLLAMLSVLAAGVFTSPTRASFLTLASGWLLCRARRTTSAMVVAARAVGRKHFSAYHRFFSTARWCEPLLRRALMRLLVSTFCPEGEIVLVGDGTVRAKTGPKIAGAAYWHNHCAAPRQQRSTIWGHSYVMLGLVLKLWGATYCVPVGLMLYRCSKECRRAGVRYRSRGQILMEMVRDAMVCAPGRAALLLVDGQYGCKDVLRSLPRGLTVITHLRHDAALWAPPRRPVHRNVGRPRTHALALMLVGSGCALVAVGVGLMRTRGGAQEGATRVAVRPADRPRADVPGPETVPAPEAVPGLEPPVRFPAGFVVSGEAASPTPEDDLPASRAEESELNRLIALMATTRRGDDEELQRAIERVAAMGDAVLPRVVAELERPGQDRLALRYRLVTVMKLIGTPAARENLLAVALGKGRLAVRAARAYIAAAPEATQVKRLLASPEKEVLEDALLALKGERVDEVVLDAARSVLRSTPGRCWGDQVAAASVLAKDPTTGFAEERVRAIAEAVPAVAASRNGNEVIGMTWVTQSEWRYRHYIRSLAEIPGGDDCLRQIASETDGRTWQVVTIARGMRGDHGVRSDLTELVRRPELGALRALAVEAIGKVGTREDIAWLKELAASDPMVRDSGSDVRVPGRDERVYPVRRAARTAIARINARFPAGR